MGKGAAIILIDIQNGFDDFAYWGGKRNNPQLEDNARQLLTYWRTRQWPVIHVRHDSANPNSVLRPGQWGNEFKAMVEPTGGEPIFAKQVNSAFIGTDLERYLRENQIRSIVIIGISTDHCVSTSVRMASNLGFETGVVADATATFDRIGIDGVVYPAELIHQTALASLQGEFATILMTDLLMNNLSNADLDSKR